MIEEIITILQLITLVGVFTWFGFTFIDEIFKLKEYWGESPEEKSKRLEAKIKEAEELLKQHRTVKRYIKFRLLDWKNWGPTLIFIGSVLVIFFLLPNLFL